MKKKRLLLAVVTMLLAVFLTVPALAATYQAQIGSQKYKTIQLASKAVKKGQTIRLISDVSLKETQCIQLKKNTTYTIDFNGKKVTKTGGDTAKASGYAFVIRKGKVTFKNANLSVVKKSGKTPGAVLVYSGAKFTQQGGKIVGKVTKRGGSSMSLSKWKKFLHDKIFVTKELDGGPSLAIAYLDGDDLPDLVIMQGAVSYYKIYFSSLGGYIWSYVDSYYPKTGVFYSAGDDVDGSSYYYVQTGSKTGNGVSELNGDDIAKTISKSKVKEIVGSVKEVELKYYSAMNYEHYDLERAFNQAWDEQVG